MNGANSSFNGIGWKRQWITEIIISSVIVHQDYIENFAKANCQYKYLYALVALPCAATCSCTHNNKRSNDNNNLNQNCHFNRVVDEESISFIHWYVDGALHRQLLRLSWRKIMSRESHIFVDCNIAIHTNFPWVCVCVCCVSIFHRRNFHEWMEWIACDLHQVFRAKQQFNPSLNPIGMSSSLIYCESGAYSDATWIRNKSTWIKLQFDCQQFATTLNSLGHGTMSNESNRNASLLCVWTPNWCWSSQRANTLESRPYNVF